MKVFVEVLSLIAFLLGSPINVPVKADSSIPARPAPVQTDGPVHAQQSVVSLK